MYILKVTSRIDKTTPYHHGKSKVINQMYYMIAYTDICMEYIYIIIIKIHVYCDLNICDGVKGLS